MTEGWCSGRLSRIFSEAQSRLPKLKEEKKKNAQDAWIFFFTCTPAARAPVPVCAVSQQRAAAGVTRVTARPGPPAWLEMATDGSTAEFRRLGSLAMSHTRAHTHTFYHCGGTQLAHCHILPSSLLLSSCKQTYTGTLTHTHLRSE